MKIKEVAGWSFSLFSLRSGLYGSAIMAVDDSNLGFEELIMVDLVLQLIRAKKKWAFKVVKCNGMIVFTGIY